MIRDKRKILKIRIREDIVEAVDRWIADQVVPPRQAAVFEVAMVQFLEIQTGKKFSELIK